MSQYIISEFYSFKPDLNLIREAEEHNKPIILSGILQKANTLNRNGRVYPYDILKREATEYMKLVEEGTATGELDHPDSAVVSLANVSHRVLDMWWQGEDLYGKVQITETPAGDILKGLLKSGVMLGISSRGVGSVKSVRGEDLVQEDFELIAFDFVSSPSTPGAYLFKEGRQWGMIPLKEENKKIVKCNNGKCEIMPKTSTISENSLKFTGLKSLDNQKTWDKIIL